jgi:hypothetical protein
MVKRKKAKPGEAFHFHNGMTAETKSQLLVQLKQMSEEEFSSYVNERKNDFYNWLKDCLDTELAIRIKDVTDKSRMIALLK